MAARALLREHTEPLNYAPSPERVGVQVLHTTDDFAALGVDWNRLHEAAATASVFNSWSWQYRWWQTYGRGQPLLILYACESGRPLGILPLYIQTVPILGVKVRLLRLVGSGGDTYPDDLGPILAPGRETAVAIALASALMRLADFDVLLLDDIDAQSQFPAAVLQVGGIEGLECAKSRAQRIVYLDLPRDWTRFLGSLSAQRRQRIRRLRRKLASTHSTRFLVWDAAAGLDKAVDRLTQLHRKRWQLAGGSASFASTAYVEFHRGVIKACFMRGWLRLYCLEVAGEIAAILYCYRFRDRVFLMQAGFDPKYAKLSIGTVLLGHALEHAIAEGTEVFDFLRGHHPYKEDLATGCRETVCVRALRQTPGALAYRVARIAVPALKARARSLAKALRASLGGGVADEHR